eukprot:166268_1
MEFDYEWSSNRRSIGSKSRAKGCNTSSSCRWCSFSLIEGMGIMFTKMMSPQMPSPEEMAAMGAQDPLAPPTTGGIGLSSAAAATSPPPPPAGYESSSSGEESDSSGLDPFAILAGRGGSSGGGEQSFSEFGNETSFTSGQSSNVVEAEKKAGWWPFGSK